MATQMVHECQKSFKVISYNPNPWYLSIFLDVFGIVFFHIHDVLFIDSKLTFITFRLYNDTFNVLISICSINHPFKHYIAKNLHLYYTCLYLVVYYICILEECRSLCQNM